MKQKKNDLWDVVKQVALGRVETPVLPVKFKEFNEYISPPIHPESRKAIGILDYQIKYFDAWQKYHKLILNKSRKIGATETALRIILYNIFMGRYADHGIIIVAGNKQQVANKFIKRLANIMKLKKHGFKDLEGVDWSYNDLVTRGSSSSLEFYNGALVEAFPANDSVRGLDNTICIFMSEAAFID